jgi:hypothetical protein
MQSFSYSVWSLLPDLARAHCSWDMCYFFQHKIRQYWHFYDGGYYLNKCLECPNWLGNYSVVCQLMPQCGQSQRQGRRRNGAPLYGNAWDHSPIRIWPGSGSANRIPQPRPPLGRKQRLSSARMPDAMVNRSHATVPPDTMWKWHVQLSHETLVFCGPILSLFMSDW